MGFKFEFQACEKAFSIPRMIKFIDVAASAVGVHAAVQEGAALAFPGPFTNPAIPRSIQIVFAAGWQGGDITIKGTDQFNRPQTEVIADVAGTTVQGVKIWKTITSAAKELVAGTTDLATMQTGTKIGLLFRLTNGTGLLFCGVTSEAFVALDATYHGFTPTTAPNGTNDYILLLRGVSQPNMG